MYHHAGVVEGKLGRGRPRRAWSGQWSGDVNEWTNLSPEETLQQGRSHKFVLGRYKTFSGYKTLIFMSNYRFNVIFPHKKFLLGLVLRVYTYTLYTPVATPLQCS